MDSQGSCCSCSFEDIIGLSDKNLDRGKLCKAFNLGAGSATAHCLRFDSLWYSAYTISAYQLYYEIEIKVIKDCLIKQDLI
jgi:hypothetical protein